jgi:steroid delta-isomerase-like uncharacterized protein
LYEQTLKIRVTTSTSPAQIRRLVHELYTAWSLHQPERIDLIFTDDAVYEDVPGGQIVRGKEAIKQLLRAAYAWAPDFRVAMKSLIVADDIAATEWVSEGIQTGPIGELPASGNSFQLRGASILNFQNGKIAKVTDYYDMATFLRQLGGTT